MTSGQIVTPNLATPGGVTPGQVLAFWTDAGPERWFAQNDAFDHDLRGRFQALWQAARDGQLSSWRTTDDGLLALIIVLDQFPRNMFRGHAAAFSTDAHARQTTTEAIARSADLRADPQLRAFVYMPFMHSENVADQDHSVALFRELGDPKNLKYAELHADIIRRFGRFPHRNAVLGRTTTPEEKSFLDAGGFAG